LEQIEEWVEELKVRWFMLDAMQKQACILGLLYLGYTLADIGGALVKARIQGGAS
jgi:uncharacterized protein with HEPN domain